MPSCKGTAAKTVCLAVLKKCTKCGLVGCTQVRNGEKCSNNITRDSGGMCRNCGGQLKPL